MTFVKERIYKADNDLFASFEAYDYNNARLVTWISAREIRSKLVVDRDRKIYFFYVSGGQHLDQHPYSMI